MEIYNFNINNQPYEVKVMSVKGNLAQVEVNGIPYSVDLGDTVDLELPIVARASKTIIKQKQAGSAEMDGQVPSPAAKPPPTGEANTIVSPMPGNIFKVNVSEGDMVHSGDVVVIIEAMKMENQIRANQDGKVAVVHVKEGEVVPEGAVLISLDG